jgi:hypothetical protein
MKESNKNRKKNPGMNIDESAAECPFARLATPIEYIILFSAALVTIAIGLMFVI